MAEPAIRRVPEPTAVEEGSPGRPEEPGGQPAGAVGARNVPLQPGQVVGLEDSGGWRVRRHIADGGFSSVYEVMPASAATAARHGPDSRALKCLWGTPAEITTIGGEAAKMAVVSGHENVLGLVASFRFDLPEQPYGHHVGLVLELAAEDLPTFARRARPGEQPWAAVFEQVAAGLEHIHSRRGVHGDIKPTNLLRVGPRFAIADFGVSAPLETTRSAGIGWARTIAFWPPESASQGELDSDGVRRPPAEGWRATQAGDVWALAVTMHRVLAGRHITPGTTPEQQYELVCLGRYTIDDRLGDGWRRLLADCLVHEPEHRVVTTAAELRRRLAELALPDDYAGVPWNDRAPRLVAALDLAGSPGSEPDSPVGVGSPVGVDAAVGMDGPYGADGASRVNGPYGADGAGRMNGANNSNVANGANIANEASRPNRVNEPYSANGTAAGGAQEAGSGAGPAVLVLTMTAEGGRVSGTVVRDRLLLAAARHLTDDVIPSLAQQVRDSQRALAASSSYSPDEEAARTYVVQAVEIEHTRQLSVAVADVTRQRDRLAADRDRLTRHRDELADERDRLRRDYSDLARRLERLERGQLPPYGSSEPTMVIPAQRSAARPVPPPARGNGWSGAGGQVMRWPDRTKVIPPATPPAAPPAPAPAEAADRSDRSGRSDRSDRSGRSGPTVPPTAAPVRPAVAPSRRRGPIRWLARLVRRLIVMIVVLAVVAVLGIAVAAKLSGVDPGSLLQRGTSRVLDRATSDG